MLCLTFGMPPNPYLFAIPLVIVGVSVVALLFWAHRYAAGACARRLRGRTTLSEDELVSLFHPGPGDTCDPRLLPLLRLIGEALEVDFRKLRPTDSLRQLLEQSWVDHHYHVESLMVDLERFVGGSLDFQLPEDVSLAQLVEAVILQSRE